MHSSVGHLLRRGMEIGKAHFDKEPKDTYHVPTWAAVLIGLTVLMFMFISSMVEYTFGRVVPTLLIVESPEEIVFEPLTTSDPDAPLNKTVDSENLLVKQQPITASFRQTLLLLSSKGGFRARFRGISIFFVYTILVQWISQMISIVRIPILISQVIAAVMCAQLSLAWTHIVISDPSPKPWFRRVPSIRVWKKVAGPTAILAIAEQLAIVLPIYLSYKYGFVETLDDFTDRTVQHSSIMALKAFSILALSLCLGFFVVIPANVALTRVQASLLSDEYETIVPFDRSFGGKVIPEVIGGTGVIGMRDAWTTFDWSARVRLVKAYAKVFAMQVALGLFFSITISAELYLIIGKDWKSIFPGSGKDDQVMVL